MPTDQALEAAKWFQIPMLVSYEELHDLFALLGDVHIVKTLSKVERGASYITVSDFLELYKDYVDTLKSGSLPDLKRYRGPFSSVITNDLDALFSLPIENYEVIKVKKPIIQMQHHTMTWSKEEGKFRSQLFGKESIPWGLMFSYPQIVLDKETKEVIKGEIFPNSRLFKAIQLWQRKKTVPTPFLVEGKRINAPQRIGKMCFEWINNHPSLKELCISVSKYTTLGQRL